MNDFEKLKTIFTASEAEEQGIKPYILLCAVESGELEKLYRGVYRKASCPDGGIWELLLAVSKRVKQANAICMLSALSYHGLTDSIPETVWLLVDNATRTSLSGLSLLRLRNPNWGIGISDDAGLRVTTIERTLVEMIAYSKKCGPTEAYIPLKETLRSKKTTAYELLKMARCLGLERRVRPSLEPFLYER